MAPDGANKQVWADLVCVLILISLCLAIGLPRYRTGLDIMDEGALASGAARVLDGQIPHRDFVTLQGPLAYYTAAAAFQLFGISLASLRIFGFGIYLLLAILIYVIARIFARRMVSLVASIPATILGIPYFHFVPFAVWQGIASTALVILFYLCATRSDSPGVLGLASGLMCAVSLLTRQDQGLYAIVAVSVYTIVLWRGGEAFLKRSQLRPLFFSWLAGILLGTLPWVIFWLMRGAMPEVIRQLIVFPLTTYAKTSSLPFPKFSLHEGLAGNAVVALFYLPPFIQAFAAFQLWEKFRRDNFGAREAGIVFILVWSFLYYCQALTRSDRYHLLIVLVPFFILCAASWEMILQRASARSAGVKYILSIAALALLGLFLLKTKTIFLDDDRAPQEMSLPRSGIRADGGQNLAKFINDIQKTVPPNRSILCLPYEPMFYFLANRRNPTRWDYIWPGDESAADLTSLVAQARRDPPALVVIQNEALMTNYAADILDYVHATYRKKADLGGFFVYLPK
jgi:hypothetical protein